MLRVVQSGTGRPISFPVDPNAIFQPGMIAQVKVIGNDVVMGVSDGIAPIGIIDDVKDTAFTRPSIDEVVIIEASVINVDGYGNFTLGADASQTLQNANIVETSFTSDLAGLQLNSVNGVITARSGKALNYTTPDSTTPNAIRALVRYSYFVPNISGEDTTLGSGRLTLWFTRGIFQTDQFEMTPFAPNANLYVSSDGKLTTEQTLPNQPVIGMVIVPPAAHNTILEFLWA
jgi:hypothetical protein